MIDPNVISTRNPAFQDCYDDLPLTAKKEIHRLELIAQYVHRALAESEDHGTRTLTNLANIYIEYIALGDGDEKKGVVKFDMYRLYSNLAEVEPLLG